VVAVIKTWCLMRCVSIAGVPPAPTLVAEATRRSGVVWVGSPTVAPTLVWHLWHDDAAYVVCGGSEQSLPALGPAATVTVRSKAGPRVVDWAAAVSRVEPGTALWDTVTPLLAAARLNAPDAAGLAARWATSSTVLRLAPQSLRVGP
jgi:hypothetical protein